MPTVQQVQEAIRMGWQMGRLSYKLKAPQHLGYDKFYSKRAARKLLIVEGRRCRKSTLLLILHSETNIRTAGIQTAYVAPVEKGLADYISPIIGVVFSDCPDDLLPRYRGKENDLLFPNGSRVVFNGCNMRQYRYMRGQKLALATVDEMAEVDDLEAAVDDVLFPAVWDSDGEMVLSGTPPPIPSPDDPVVRYCETAKLSDSYVHATVYEAGYSHEKIAEALRETGKGEIGEKESLAIAKICDPALGHSVTQIYDFAKAEGVSKEYLTRFMREFMAWFVRDESFVIVPEFDETAHVRASERPAYYDLLYKGSGADLGVADKTIEVFGYYDFPRAKIVIKSEFFIEGAEVRTDIFAERHKSCVAALGWNGNGRHSFWSDNSNLMLLNDLAALHGVHIGATEKEDKAEWLNLVRILFKQNKIEIDPSCKLLIATLNGAFWKDAKKLDYGRSKALGHMDALDALIYFVRNLNMSTNPFPVNYDLTQGAIYDSNTHVYPTDWNRRAHTDEGRALERIFSKKRFDPPKNKPIGLAGL